MNRADLKKIVDGLTDTQGEALTDFLDEAVSFVKEAEASVINNSGHLEQLEYLYGKILNDSTGVKLVANAIDEVTSFHEIGDATNSAIAALVCGESE